MMPQANLDVCYIDKTSRKFVGARKIVKVCLEKQANLAKHLLILFQPIARKTAKTHETNRKRQLFLLTSTQFYYTRLYYAPKLLHKKYYTKRLHNNYYTAKNVILAKILHKNVL